jgi:aryl hydrocarbon receptor
MWTFFSLFQSDILHQSAYELIHSEDRDEFKRHLQWNEKLLNEHQNLTLEQILTNSGKVLLKKKKNVIEIFHCRT